MKKKSLSCKFAVTILLFSLILIPVTSSISFAQDESAAAGGVAKGGAAGLSNVAVIGFAATAVAIGVAVAVAASDDEAATTHHATVHH